MEHALYRSIAILIRRQYFRKKTSLIFVSIHIDHSEFVSRSTPLKKWYKIIWFFFLNLEYGIVLLDRTDLLSLWIYVGSSHGMPIIHIL